MHWRAIHCFFAASLAFLLLWMSLIDPTVCSHGCGLLRESYAQIVHHLLGPLGLSALCLGVIIAGITLPFRDHNEREL